MAKKSKRPASRGSVNNIILETLTTGDKYGYEIIKEVEEKTNGKIKLKQPSLYSSLNRFEDKEFVTSYWEDSEIGGKRHYYSITSKGLEFYENSKKSAFDKIEFKNRQNKLSKQNKSSSHQSIEDESVIEDDEILLTNPDMSLFELDDEDVDVTSDEYIRNLNSSINSNTYDEIENIEEDYLKIETIEEDYFEDSDEQENTPSEIEFFDDEEELTQIDEVKNLDDIFEEIKIENAKVEAISQNNTKKEITINPIDWKSNNHTYSTNTYFNQEKHDESMKKLYGDLDDNMVIENKIQDQENKKKSLEILNSTELVEENIIPIKEEISVELKTAENQQQNNDLPEKKFIVDENGIIKIENDQTDIHKSNKVFDNVIYRTSQTGHNITTYNDLGVSKHSAFSRQTSNFKSVTEEEKPKEQIQEEPKKVDINYKSILGELYTNDLDENINPPTPTDELNNDTLTNDVYNYKSNIISESIKEEPPAQNSDDIIDNFEKSGIKIKHAKNDYIEKDEKDYEFILVNKVKFVFGLIMLLLMLLQTTIVLLSLKSTNLVFNKDYTLFGIAYGLSVGLSLIYIIPILLNKTKRKEQNFRFSYSIILGTLSFLICCVFTYAINTFVGLNLSNINLYATSMLLPTILALNFIIGPIIYKLLLNNKHFY